MTEWLSRQRKAVFAVVVLLCALGARLAGLLPVAIFPQLTVPRIVLAADAGDAPLETTLNQITRPLEAAVGPVPGVQKVLSTTTRGSAGLDVTFADGTDMPLALQRVQSQLAEARGALPAGASVQAALINPSLFPIMGYSLTSPTLDLAALRGVALTTLRPRLARLPGVAQVRVTGGDAPEYLVSVRAESLAARGLSLQDVTDALAKANGVSSVGNFDRSFQRYDILVSGLLRDERDITQVTVAAPGGVPVALSDLATVTRSAAPRTVLATGDGRLGVVVNIVKQPDANTIQVAESVRATLAELRKSLPPGVQTSLFYDQSEIVRQSESSVLEAILVGGALALFVLIAFLGNARAAAIVLLLLPLTLLITVCLMRLLGQTLNIMTLGALAIALGLVIDDGIVVVENMVHELENGKARNDAVAAGLRAITPAMLGSSLTTMAAFLPLTFLGGVTGQFFAPLALVLVATLFVSLALALLLTPLLALRLLPERAEKKPARPSLFDRFAARYARLLAVCLRRRAVVLWLLVPLVLVAYFVFTRLPTGFFPEFDEGAFVIDYLLPPGTSLAETDRISSKVEGMLGKTPEVAAWSRLAGARSGTGLELTESSQGDILVRLKTKRGRASSEIMADVRAQIEATQPAFQVDLIQILQDGIGDIAGSPAPIEVKIYGPDAAKLAELATAAGEIVTKTPGVVDENDGLVETGPTLAVEVDSLRAARYGLSTEAVIAAATSALRGTIATTVQSGETSVAVRVRSARQTTDFALLPLAAPNGATVPLGSVARLVTRPGTPQLTRENQQPMVAVTARLEGRDLGSAVADVRARLAKGLKLPPGYRLEFGGLYASQQQSFAQLAGVLALAVLLVSTLLLVQLRSLRQTFALLCAAVLSLSGVLLGLWITRTPLNISSFTGAVMIVGIVTENGIVLFDFFNAQRQAHPDRPLSDALLDACHARLRPILMTTLGAILALFPLALGLGAGAAMQKPLAVAVIGGLSVSMLFTLLVAPALLLALSPKTKKV